VHFTVWLFRLTLLAAVVALRPLPLLANGVALAVPLIVAGLLLGSQHRPDTRSRCLANLVELRTCLILECFELLSCLGQYLLYLRALAGIQLDLTCELVHHSCRTRRASRRAMRKEVHRQDAGQHTKRKGAEDDQKGLMSICDHFLRPPRGG